MDIIGRIKDFFGEKLIQTLNYAEYEGILSTATIEILKNVGLPIEAQHFGIRFGNYLYNINENYLAIGETFGGEYVLIDLKNHENIVCHDLNFSLDQNARYLCKNIDALLKCLFEYEYFLEEIIENEKLGPYRLNRQQYADYLSEKLKSHDEVIMDFSNWSKCRYWYGIIENLEMGI